MGLGYYDYHKDGFGPICETCPQLIESLQDVMNRKYVMEEIYQKRCDEFFYFHDRDYCKRNYEAIKAI